MGTYRRRGHYRRGRGGALHWVSEHSVTRAGSGHGRSTPARRPPRPPRAKRAAPEPAPQPYSARWARPNARCPVCGAPVYFYANRHGSRVFFDELGWPWPKHPCTDNSRSTALSVALSGRPVAPQPYGLRDRVRRPRGWSAKRRDGVDRGRPHVVVGVWRREDGTVVHLRRARRREPVMEWFSPTPALGLTQGDLVFMRGAELTFVNTSTLEVWSGPVVWQRRVRRPRPGRLRRRSGPDGVRP